jgi:hypothetical protein
MVTNKEDIQVASSTILVKTEAPGIVRQALSVLPGIVLLGIVGLSGKFIEQSLVRYSKAHHLTLPNIEYVLWAILIGSLISNT